MVERRRWKPSTFLLQPQKRKKLATPASIVQKSKRGGPREDAAPVTPAIKKQHLSKDDKKRKEMEDGYTLRGCRSNKALKAYKSNFSKRPDDEDWDEGDVSRSDMSGGEGTSVEIKYIDSGVEGYESGDGESEEDEWGVAIDDHVVRDTTEEDAMDRSGGEDTMGTLLEIAPMEHEQPPMKHEHEPIERFDALLGKYEKQLGQKETWKKWKRTWKPNHVELDADLVFSLFIS
ncbi:hypothetical protein Syun_014671 [Stephania yunnanensis]|uniref:Uncharacterized protein n=1 Tax=Stephania yunnanensis TaxID=152371 RepID=A0AAP0PC55_9MAGN